MTEPRITALQIEEDGQDTFLSVETNEKVSFQVTFTNKKIEDQELSVLRRVIENQRAEITNALNQNSALEALLQEAKRPKKARR